MHRDIGEEEPMTHPEYKTQAHDQRILAAAASTQPEARVPHDPRLAFMTTKMRGVATLRTVVSRALR